MLKGYETEDWFQIWIRLCRNEISDEELHQINLSGQYNNLNRVSELDSYIEPQTKLTARDGK